MQEVTEREVASWPRDEPLTLHPRLQALTLEVILRAVFGLDAGERLDALRERLTRDPRVRRPPVLAAAGAPARPQRWFERRRADADALIYETIDERRVARPGRHGERRRHPRHAARGAARGRLADVAGGAARRADDAARGGPRDDRLRARVGVRAPGADARRVGPAHRGDRLRRRRRLRDRHGPGDAPPPPGAAERGAAADHGAGRDRRVDVSGGCLPARGRVPDPPRPGDLPRSYAFRPERFLDNGPAPTPGSRSAAAAAAASARASPSSR